MSADYFLICILLITMQILCLLLNGKLIIMATKLLNYTTITTRSEMYTNKKLLIIELIGLLFCLLFSFLLHYFYEWSNQNQFITWFSPINESVWEHGKLLFYPYFIFSIIELFSIKNINYKSFITAKAIPLIFCIPAMIAIYYTYSGVLGANIEWVNIAIAVVIIIAMFAFSYSSYRLGWWLDGYQALAVIAIGILIMIIVFTYYPINIPLFTPK